MLYPVYVHAGDDRHAHGVTFPDFPVCFAAADTWDGLPAAIQEAVQAHFHDEPGSVPPPTPLEQLARQPEFAGGLWLLAEVDLSRIETRAVRLNISLPAHLVQQIDARAAERHMSRRAAPKANTAAQRAEVDQ